MTVNVGLIGPKRSQKGYGLGQFIAREILNNPVANLIAVMGTDSKSVKKAVRQLNSMPDISKKFEGKSYTTGQKNNFFSDKKMDIVVICSPQQTHEEYISAGLKSNKNILVEKPLIYCPEIPLRKRIKKAHELVKKADNKRLLLSTNCQRVAVIPVLSKEFGLSKVRNSIDIEMTVGAKNNNVETAEFLFGLLIAHPLSIFVKYGIDYKSLKVTKYSENSNSGLCCLEIEGTCKKGQKLIKYRIVLTQTIKASFASLKIKIDDNGPVDITTELSESGELKTKYFKADEKKIAYSEDTLKKSIGSMIEAVAYKDSKHNPLISNKESLLIYAFHEILKDKIGKYKKNRKRKFT